MCEEIDRLFSKIAEASAERTFFRSAILHSYFLQLLIMLYVKRPARSPAKNQVITDIMDYINDHLREDISIDDICLHLHISKYYACHLFKKITDMTAGFPLRKCCSIPLSCLYPGLPCSLDFPAFRYSAGLLRNMN